MVSSKRTSISDAGSEEDRSSPVPVPSRLELANAFAQALDLAEGRRLGHAARVAYIALSLAQTLELPDEEQRVAFYAALLHDAGAAAISPEIRQLEDVTEEALFRAGPGKTPQQLAMAIAPSEAATIVDVLHAHPERGAQVARDLGFEPAVQEAILVHHERWDGTGYPGALQGAAASVVGRLIAAADLIESLISDDLNALIARRNLLAMLVEHAGQALDPEMVQCAQELSRSDAFWLGLYSEELPNELPTFYQARLADVERSPADLHTFATVFATLADAKGEYTARHSERTAELVDSIAEALNFSPGRREMLHVAALLHDVGLLGVPARVISKPDILSLAEMEIMRNHPSYTQLILEAVPGLDAAARWAGAHHERPDGKGYAELLENDEIPLEARIIAVADTYVALTSTRPYRQALTHEDAQHVLLGGAGTQLDAKLVRLLCSLPVEAMSSQSAPR